MEVEGRIGEGKFDITHQLWLSRHISAVFPVLEPVALALSQGPSHMTMFGLVIPHKFLCAAEIIFQVRAKVTCLVGRQMCLFHELVALSRTLGLLWRRRRSEHSRQTTICSSGCHGYRTALRFIFLLFCLSLPDFSSYIFI